MLSKTQTGDLPATQPSSAVLSIPASDETLRSDMNAVLSDLEQAGITAAVGSLRVSHKPTINSNNGG